VSETSRKKGAHKNFLWALEPSPQLAFQISLRGKYGGGGGEGFGDAVPDFFAGYAQVFGAERYVVADGCHDDGGFGVLLHHACGAACFGGGLSGVSGGVGFLGGIFEGQL